MTAPQRWQVKHINDQQVRDAVRRARDERTERNRHLMVLDKMNPVPSGHGCRGTWWAPEALAELTGAPVDFCRCKLEQACKRNLVEPGGSGLDDCRWVQDHLTNPPTKRELGFYPGLRKWAVFPHP